MNSLWLWIGIAIVVIVLIVVFIAIGKKRGESKKVSFEKPTEEEPKQLTQEQKSGNYQAKSGFNFAPAGSKEPEKVAQEKPQQAQPQQAKQEQQPESSEKSEQSEPSATDIANAQLNGEEPPAAKRPEPAKDKNAAPEKAAKQEEPQRQEPAADEQPKKSAEPAESKKPAEDGDVPKQDKDTGKADVAGDEAKSESKSESASTSEAESKPAADKPAADKTEGKGTAGTAAAAAAAAGGVGSAASAASGDRQESAADDADKEPADQVTDQSDKPDSAQASTPASGEAEAEDKEAKGSEQSAPAAAEKPAAEGTDDRHRGEPDHEEKDPEDVVSVEAAEVEDESPVFDAVVDDKDADHIEERVDNREEAEEAAAADAQTDAAEAAKEQTPVPDGEPAAAGQPTEDIAPAGGRLGRLRGRLSRSQNAIGQGLMGILSAGDLDEDAWEEIEDTLIMADLGTKSTMKVTDSLRDKIAERGVSSEEEARAMLRECLIEACHPEMDRSIRAMPNDGKPAIVMVVGVNGTGKTTTTGKLARVLVSMDHSVLLGAADTFRAAAADQLETWGRRVGAETVRGKEGADPASVAFDAVATGVEQQVDVVLVDTAGRLHTSTDLMDQLGKVKRVVEKKTEVDEVLLVLDATVGQNGLAQARIFREVVDISGVVLTKLDGTAKGGIVFQVQEELGVPVKLVGLGEGADDLAPFEVEGFVDALLGEK